MTLPVCWCLAWKLIVHFALDTVGCGLFSWRGYVSSWPTAPFAYHHGCVGPWPRPEVIPSRAERACSSGGSVVSWAGLCVPGEMSRRCVYVGTMPKSTTEEMLKVIFPMANGITMKPADDANMRWVPWEPVSFVLRAPLFLFTEMQPLLMWKLEMGEGELVWLWSTGSGEESGVGHDSVKL